VHLKTKGTNMARPIKPTPVLDSKSGERFILKVEAGQKSKTGPVPTPKLADTLKRFAADAAKEK
jgi:hypothetical protein